jgi:hypothetical protein
MSVKRYTYDGHRAGFVAAHDYDALAASFKDLQHSHDLHAACAERAEADNERLRGLLREVRVLVPPQYDLCERIDATLGTADSATPIQPGAGK